MNEIEFKYVELEIELFNSEQELYRWYLEEIKLQTPKIKKRLKKFNIYEAGI